MDGYSKTQLPSLVLLFNGSCASSDSPPIPITLSSPLRDHCTDGIYPSDPPRGGPPSCSLLSLRLAERVQTPRGRIHRDRVSVRSWPSYSSLWSRHASPPRCQSKWRAWRRRLRVVNWWAHLTGRIGGNTTGTLVFMLPCPSQGNADHAMRRSLRRRDYIVPQA